jgi:hypothetical protein
LFGWGPENKHWHQRGKIGHDKLKGVPYPENPWNGGVAASRCASLPMQRPTLTNVRIHSTSNALHVFNAVVNNIVPTIIRRLDAEECRVILPGNVYMWEQQGANAESTDIGMERWMDGMGWGLSRIRDISGLCR